MKKPVVLVIMDGYGISNKDVGNAIKAANKPHLDFLLNNYPSILLDASENAVGLPQGQMGNSEVGHLNIGAGRIVYQSLTLINKAIDEHEFENNPAFMGAIKHVKKHNSILHIMGLLSDGGVHSHLDHILALLKLANEQGIKQVCFHAMLDGRDVEPQTSLSYLKQIQDYLMANKMGCLASIAGRYYAMDRDKNFERTKRYYDVIVQHKGSSFLDYHDYIKQEYARQGAYSSDEFVYPAYYQDAPTIQDNDAIIFANFRPDRAIQIATVLSNPDYYKDVYNPAVHLHNIYFVSMMKYADSVLGSVAFSHPVLSNVLGVCLANQSYHQLRIAETEKYAHVTFFFDGLVKYDGIENPQLPNCQRILIPSPKVATYDLKPEMSAYLITEALLKELDKGDLDVVILNYANCDMVGHTAVKLAVKQAVEVVDECVGRVYAKVQQMGGVMLVTADHGNAESIADVQGHPLTAHTTNPVPLIITSHAVKFIINRGKLADLAPTILYLLGAQIPGEMTGSILIKKGGN